MSFITRSVSILAISLSSSYVYAVDSILGAQGFSSAINSPVADTLPEGEFTFLYANQVEIRGGYFDQHNFNFAIGLYDWLEIDGHNFSYTDDLNSGSDLSANVKLKMPFIPEDWFKLSVGIQDLGGAANHLDAKYIVASKDFFNNELSISVGAGTSISLLGRGDGLFTSLRYQPYEWLQMQAEYDAADYNAAIVLSTPSSWFDNNIKLTSSLLLGSSNEYLKQDTFFSVGITVPAYSSQPKKINRINLEVRDDNTLNKPEDYIDSTSENALFEDLKKFKSKLLDIGFEDVEVGYTQEQLIHINVDSRIFNRNYIDAIGVILGGLSKEVSNSKAEFQLNLTKGGINQVSVAGNLHHYSRFVEQGKGLNVSISNMPFSEPINMVRVDKTIHGVKWPFRPDVIISPDLRHALGTDFGMFDYSLAMRVQVLFDLWAGAYINLDHIGNVAESDSFRNPREFKSARHNAGLKSYGFIQQIHPSENWYGQVEVGRYREIYRYLSFTNSFFLDDGKHEITLHTANYSRGEGDRPEATCNLIFLECERDYNSLHPLTRNIKLASYRYYHEALDANYEIKLGSFWNLDKGFVIKASRLFGDTNVNLAFQKTTNAFDETMKQVSVGFSVPLTSRKDYSTKYARLRGAPKWEFKTTTLVGDELNWLTPGVADGAVRTNVNLTDSLLNGGNFGKAYIYRNQSRLVEAFEKYWQ